MTFGFLSTSRSHEPSRKKYLGCHVLVLQQQPELLEHTIRSESYFTPTIHDAEYRGLY